MSTTTAESSAHDAGDEQPEQSTADASRSGFWPDETVDAICALVVVTTLTLAVLFYVMNG